MSPSIYDADMRDFWATMSDVAPILWQHGALARLEERERPSTSCCLTDIHTISLGYAGLCEMCVRMIGKSHTTRKGQSIRIERHAETE